MYIPYPPRLSAIHLPHTAAGTTHPASVSEDGIITDPTTSLIPASVRQAVSAVFTVLQPNNKDVTTTTVSDHDLSHELRRRADASSNQNVTVGVVVGVLVALFLAGLCAFLWTYRLSLTFKRKKNRRHRHHRGSTGSKSSKSSKSSSDGGGGPAPASAPPAPAAPAEGA